MVWFPPTLGVFRVHWNQWHKAPQWLPRQAPAVTGSVLGLVGSVSVYFGWVRWKVWSATSISMWQHIHLPEQIHPWDTLACCWDVKQTTNQQTARWSQPCEECTRTCLPTCTGLCISICVHVHARLCVRACTHTFVPTCIFQYVMVYACRSLCMNKCAQCIYVNVLVSEWTHVKHVCYFSFFFLLVVTINLHRSMGTATK